MNKLYLIIPSGLLVAFIIYYTQVAKPAMIAKAEAERQAVAAQVAEQERLRKLADAAAREELRKQQEEREAKERERQEKIRLEKEKNEHEVLEATEKYKAEAAKLNKEQEEIDRQIEEQRTLRENLSQQVFDLAKQEEAAKITRRNSELEIQRMYEAVVKRLDDQAEKLRLELEAKLAALDGGKK